MGEAMKNVAWWFVALVLVLLILGGCASVPRQVAQCERYQFIPVTLDSGDVVFVLNQENAVKLVQMVKGLSDGTCTLPQ
jgi:putative exporter of polyketide antibiotics